MIDTQAIKNKILDLAMRGQLTEQIKDDGTAEELYQQIVDHKKRLISSGAIKKDKISKSEKKDNAELALPHNWKYVLFSTIITLQSGQDLKPEDYNSQGNGIPYLTGASNFDVNGNLIINRWTDHPKSIAVEGDLLLSCKGTVGKIAILTIDKVHIARQFMAIRTYDIDVQFAAYFIQSVIEGIKTASKGLIPGIERNDILQLKMPLPPLPEQKRIVEIIRQSFSILDTIDELQLQYEDNLTVLKSKLIDAAIQGKLTEQLPEDGTAEELCYQIRCKKNQLVAQGVINKEKPLPDISEEEIPFEIPNNWKWIRLGDYCQKITDYVASGSFASLHENVRSLKTPDYAIMVKTADFSNGFTTNLTYTDKHGYDFLKNSNLFGGELILSNVGSIGKCFIVPKLDSKMTLAPNAVMVRAVDEESKDFLYYFFSSNQGFKELDAISTGVAIKKFNKTELKKILVPIPPIAEQKRIVKKLEEVLMMCDG